MFQKLQLSKSTRQQQRVLAKLTNSDVADLLGGKSGQETQITTAYARNVFQTLTNQGDISIRLENRESPDLSGLL